MARPRAEQRGDGRGAAHDATSSITVSCQPSHATPLTTSHCGARLQPPHHTPLLQKKHLIMTETCSLVEDVASVSVVQGVVDDREGETCLPGHSTSETDSQGDGKELWSSVAQCGALWDPRCPLNAPDAYPFHTISLCVTNSRRSANGNG